MTEELNTRTHTDIKRLVWIERFLPEGARPFAYLMRLDRPIGIWLLLIPSLWGIMLAGGSAKALILFSLGAVIMRGAGCVMNDIWDRDLDRLVDRTKARPIASGAVNVKQALLFLATLLLIGLVILLQFNLMTVILGFASIPLIVLYPLMKRITYWPQVFLGLTFNFGALMGYSAISGQIGAASVLLYLGGIFWTIAYDTIYAHQDKEDDLIAGVKSTALIFGERSKMYVSGFYAASAICLALAIVMGKGFGLGVLVLGLAYVHFYWQMRTWQPEDQQSSLRIFKSNRDAGLLVLLALLF